MNNEQLITVPSFLSDTDSGMARAAAAPVADCCQGSICQGQSVVPVPCSDGSTQICIGGQSCSLCEYGSQDCIYLCEVCQGQICFTAEGCPGQVCTCVLVSSQEGEDEEDPEFTIVDVTDTTITIHVTGVGSRTQWRVLSRLASDPNDRTGQANLTRTADFEYTFAGLQPDTTYAVNVGAWNSSTGSYDWIGRQDVTTDSSVEEWDWWSIVASGQRISISAAEWNAFCSFINEVRVDNGLPSYTFTKVYSGDEMSAAIINQARTAISSISGHGTLPTAAARRDPITANLFLQLANAVNAAL